MGGVTIPLPNNHPSDLACFLQCYLQEDKEEEEEEEARQEVGSNIPITHGELMCKISRGQKLVLKSFQSASLLAQRL